MKHFSKLFNLAFLSVVLVFLSLGAFEIKIPTAHFAANTDDRAPADTSDSFRSDSDADNIRLYVISPLNVGGSVESTTSQSEVKYESKSLGEFALGRTVRLYTQIAKKYHLCQGLGSRFEDWMTECQRRKPEELAVLMHFVKVHLAKLKEDRDTILALNRERANSKSQVDRLRAAFFNKCVEMGMAGELSAFDPEAGQSGGKESLGSMDLIDLCNRMDGLGSDAIDKIAARVLNLPKGYSDDLGGMPYFDYHDFVFDFLTKGDSSGKSYLKGRVEIPKNNKGKDQSSQGSGGLLLLKSLMPDFEIYFGDLEGNPHPDFYIGFYDPDAEPAQIFLAIYKMAEEFLNSPKFNNLETDGCVPSIFSVENEKDKQAYSVCLPTKVIEKVNSLPEEDAKYLRAKIARKVAILLTVELLRGGVVVADEAAKILKASNDEIAQYAEMNAKYMRNLADSYSNLLDVTFATKLEDILDTVYFLAVRYNQEVSDVAVGEEQAKETENEAITLGAYY